MPLSRPITSLELWPIRPFPSPDFIEDSSIRISSANLNSTWLIVFYEFCPSPVSVTSSSVTCLRYCIHLRSLTGAAINPRECREHANERRCLRTQYGRRTVWPLELPSPACTSQCPTSGARDVMFNEGAWIAFDWRAWCISYWLFSPTCAERYQTQFLRAALGKLWLGEGGTSFGSCYGRGELGRAVARAWPRGSRGNLFSVAQDQGFSKRHGLWQVHQGTQTVQHYFVWLLWHERWFDILVSWWVLE